MGRNNQLSQLARRDGKNCHYCDNPVAFATGDQSFDNTLRNLATRDHVVPKSMGGEGRVRNFVLACRDCNEKRGDNLYYCGCTFCTGTIEGFMNRHFGGTLGPVKPRVWKHRGQWVASWGLNSYVSLSWEKAMQRIPSQERVNV